MIEDYIKVLQNEKVDLISKIILKNYPYLTKKHSKPLAEAILSMFNMIANDIKDMSSEMSLGIFASIYYIILRQNNFKCEEESIVKTFKISIFDFIKGLNMCQFS